MLVWLPPFRVQLDLFKSRWEDWIRLPGDEFLVSAAYVHLHESKQFTGLAPFQPVEDVRVKYRTKIRPEPPTYYVTKVLKGDARIDDVASELKRDPGMPLCRYCGSSELTRERLVLEANTWKGEDWFKPQNLTRAIATNRVVQAIAEAGLTGFKFQRCEESKYRVDWPRDDQGNRLAL